jgi:hypothetical protein
MLRLDFTTVDDETRRWIRATLVPRISDIRLAERVRSPVTREA